MGGLLSKLVNVPESHFVRCLEHLVTLVLAVKTFRWLLRVGPRGLLKKVLSVVIASARVMPGLGGAIEATLQKEMAGMQKKLLGDGDAKANLQLPEIGISADVLITEARALKAQEAFETGKKWGGVYHEVQSGGQSQLEKLQVSMWELFNSTNALYPAVFPSIRKYEAEIVAMCVNLLHGSDSGAVGFLASGGTESIMLAILAYREVGREKGIEQPEIICCRTAHPALDKACHYFDLKLTKIDAGPDGRLPVDQVAKSISASTVAVYASAPTFSHGVVDDIEALAAVTRPRNIGLHVDNCLGGFYLSFLQRIGQFNRKFDFEVPGVTSISIDIHKYAFSSKGASVVCFSSTELRQKTIFPVVNGLALYVTPTLQGSRSGATIASAWATLMFMGQNGYRESCERLHRIYMKLQREVVKIQGLRLLLQSDLSILPIASDLFDIYKLASLLEGKGWNMFTSQDPPAMNICIGEQHTDELADMWLEDCRACVAELIAKPDIRIEGEAAVYGASKVLPPEILGECLKRYIDIKMTVKPASS